jgi:hypothetical protein
MLKHVILFVALVCVTSAHAQTRGSPSVVCTPDAQTVASGGLKTNVASVQHAAGKTGVLTLNCQIEQFNVGTVDWRLRLTYRDSSGTSNTAYARARLYRMGIGETSPTLMATALSNTSAIVTDNHLASMPFNHSFDFYQFVYWVRLDLRREGSETVIIYSFNLEADT